MLLAVQLHRPQQLAACDNSRSWRRVPHLLLASRRVKGGPKCQTRDTAAGKPAFHLPDTQQLVGFDDWRCLTCSWRAGG